MSAILLQGTVSPATGYLLCYIPLAAIVLGLITFFVLTDRHASRPYLRFNPFVAVKTPEQGAGSAAPAVGETPAGSLGGAAASGETAVFLGEHGATVTVPKEAVPPPAAPDRAPALEGERPAAVPKDLGRVTGINLPDVDQSAGQVEEPPANVAPPSSAEMAASTAPPASSPETALPAASAPAERAAAGLTIAAIEFNPDGNDLEGEYVLIANNTASAINMGGWTLTDVGQKHRFTFPSFMLAPGATVQLWTRAGENDAANLYWGRNTAVWNNTGDTAVLRNAEGQEISRFAYTGGSQG